MCVVAITADDACGVHLALKERAVDVDLVVDLPVVEVEQLVERGEPVAVVVALAHAAEVGAARVAGCTSLGLAALTGTQSGNALAFLEHPRAIPGRREATLEASALGKLSPGLGQADVLGTRSVAGFAPNVDLEVFGREAPACSVVVLLQRRRVAVGASVVPIVARAGPVERVAWLDVFLGLEVEPALPALRFGSRVPRDGKGLQAAGLELDEVLLERLDTEGVEDGKLGELAVRAQGFHEVAAVPLEEARRLLVVAALRVVEISEHRLLRGSLHG